MIKNQFFVICIIIIALVSGSLLGQIPVEKVYLTMEEVISRALTHNNQVKASEFSMRKANWDKKHAWTLLFPKISFNSKAS